MYIYIFLLENSLVKGARNILRCTCVGQISPPLTVEFKFAPARRIAKLRIRRDFQVSLPVIVLLVVPFLFVFYLTLTLSRVRQLPMRNV